VAAAILDRRRERGGAAGTAPPAGTIVLFDLDGTITRRDTYLVYLLGYLRRHPWRLLRALGLPFAVGLYALRLRNNTWLKTTFLGAVLGGLPRDSLTGWTEAFVGRVLERDLRPGAARRIEALQGAGVRLVLVTASFDFYAEPLARRLGFERVFCTRAEVDPEGRLTGSLAGSNCYGEQKRAVVRAWIEREAASLVWFYSDHHSDLSLLRAVDRPVAVNPTPKLRRAALELGIPIEDWEQPGPLPRLERLL
jgi:phosphatidylglycerophosphatase C